MDRYVPESQPANIFATQTILTLLNNWTLLMDRNSIFTVGIFSEENMAAAAAVSVLPIDSQFSNPNLYLLHTNLSGWKGRRVWLKRICTYSLNKPFQEIMTDRSTNRPTKKPTNRHEGSYGSYTFDNGKCEWDLNVIYIICRSSSAPRKVRYLRLNERTHAQGRYNK